MPVGYHISPDDGLITVTADGSVPLSDLARTGESLLADATYDPTLPQLLDLRGLRPVSGGKLTPLKRFIEEHYREAVRASVAVVIDEHLESAHCADIFLLTCAMHDAELFADYDQALRWLMRRAFAGAPIETLQESNSTATDMAPSTPQNR
jgi:hypothetical protein